VVRHPPQVQADVMLNPQGQFGQDKQQIDHCGVELGVIGEVVGPSTSGVHLVRPRWVVAVSRWVA